MKKKIFYADIFFIFILTFFSCRHDDEYSLRYEEYQRENSDSDTTTIINPTDSIENPIPTFTNDILPIFENFSCTSCHYSGIRDLSTYSGTIASSARLYGAIDHAPGYIAMPAGYSIKIPETDIKKIKDWLDNGMPE